MKPLLELAGKGGLPILAIMVLSVVLYWRCFRLLLWLHTLERRLRRSSAPCRSDRAALRLHRVELQEAFQQQRISIGAMIAAAPLLGLLGTVSGMAKTFETLGAGTAEKSMEGLARGISEVLVATQAGLAVAIPAMALVFVAHREVRRCVENLNRLEARS
jgi:biopolymer transport protein ExbB/TolQ